MNRLPDESWKRPLFRSFQGTVYASRVPGNDDLYVLWERGLSVSAAAQEIMTKIGTWGTKFNPETGKSYSGFSNDA